MVLLGWDRQPLTRGRSCLLQCALEIYTILFSSGTRNLADRMDSINSTVVDPCKGKRVNDFIEKYTDVGGDHVVGKEPETTVCISSSLSSFGNVTTLCAEPESISESVVVKGITARDKMFTNKSYNDDFVKSEHDPWISSQAFQMKPSVSPESSQSSSASQGEMCKFIKDEKEPSLIMDARGSDFDITSNISTMNSCYSNGKKQQFDFMVDVPSFPNNTTGQQVVLSSSPTIFVDLNQSNARQPFSEMRSESGCVSGKGIINYDVINTQSSQQHLFVCKNEVSRWPLPSSSADSQVWCQSVGMTDEQAPYSPDGIHAGYLQRSSHTYNTYSG